MHQRATAYNSEQLALIWEFIERHGSNRALLASHFRLTKGQTDGIQRRNPELWNAAVAKYNAHHISQLKDVDEVETPEPADPAAQNKTYGQTLKLQGRVSQLSKQLEAAVRERALVEDLRAMVQEAVPAFKPPTSHNLPELDEGISEETMVMMIGDVHGGEIVESSKVKFMNAYDSRVCQQRFGHYVHTHLKIKGMLERGGFRFPQLCIPLMGDMVSGTIHEIEKHSDHSIIKTCAGIASLLAHGILHTASAYPETHVLGIVGNHGRLPDQRRKVYKEPERNWDYLIYLMIQQQLSLQPHIKCVFPSSYVQQFDIRGYRFQMSHGDDVKSWGGLPAYGLDRYARNQNSGESMRSSHIDYFLAGHFHQKLEIDVGGAELILNGDMKGTDDFVLHALGKVGCPRQTFFAVHENHGITHRWDIKLQHPDEAAPRFPMTPWESLEGDLSGEQRGVYQVA